MSKKKGRFIKAFIKEQKRIGAISPSSKSLGRKMLENIEFEPAQVIVEFGPGTGVFTKEIFKKMDDNSTLYVFELHFPFYNKLKEEYRQFKNVHLINDSAANVYQYLKENNHDAADVIISSLPLTNFSKKLTIRILTAAHNILKPNGKFIQFQYTLNARKVLKKIFKNVAIRYTVANLPPAFIYTCSDENNKPNP